MTRLEKACGHDDCRKPHFASRLICASRTKLSCRLCVIQRNMLSLIKAVFVGLKMGLPDIAKQFFSIRAFHCSHVQACDDGGGCVYAVISGVQAP